MYLLVYVFASPNIIIYNETSKLNKVSEKDIQKQIEKIIEKKYHDFDNTKINIVQNPILLRITYIVFPIWDLKDLAQRFQKMI